MNTGSQLPGSAQAASRDPIVEGWPRVQSDGVVWHSLSCERPLQPTKQAQGGGPDKVTGLGELRERVWQVPQELPSVQLPGPALTGGFVINSCAEKGSSV